MSKIISSDIMRNRTDSFNFSRKIISKYLKHFVQERNDVLYAGGNIEPVHRMRVASRRLRAALSFFKTILPGKKTELWKKEISRIGQVLGRARELDVHIAFLQAAKQGLRRDSYIVNIEAMIKSLKNKRSRAQKQIERILAGFELEKNLPGLKVCLRALSSGANKQLNDRFYLHRNAVIQKRLDRLLEFTPYVFKLQSIHKLHQMRIAAKNLRYTLEIIRPWHGVRIDKYIRSSRDIQDVLGDVHELDALMEALPALTAKNKNGKLTLKYLLQECGRLRNNAYNKFVQLWRSLQKTQLWARLGGEI